ncbi:hypothetical protein ACEUA8_01380 [Aeromonas veronii]
MTNIDQVINTALYNTDYQKTSLADISNTIKNAFMALYNEGVDLTHNVGEQHHKITNHFNALMAKLKQPSKYNDVESYEADISELLIKCVSVHYTTIATYNTSKFGATYDEHSSYMIDWYCDDVEGLYDKNEIWLIDHHIEFNVILKPNTMVNWHHSVGDMINNAHEMADVKVIKIK